jgi:hypothetical protein
MFGAAAERLAAKLSDFQLPKGAISPFIERYFGSNLQYLQASLQRYTFLLTWAIAPYSSKNNAEIVLVDYGGGSGMCSLLAKEAGIGTVVYVDIYDVCCHDAQYIAEALGLAANHYVNGDIDSLLSYLKEKQISCNTVVSYDTLEHIYDIDDFLNKIGGISAGPLSLMMASGANPLNFIISRRLRKLHRKVELKGKIRQQGEDDRNPEEALVAVRTKMILSYASDLSQHEADMLAQKTRGMRREDIIKAVNSFLSNGLIPKELEHPTNTCDPLTGNWCERLLNPYSLGHKLQEAGFSAKVLAGFYGSSGKDSKLKQSARYCANLAIAVSGNLGLQIAPYYCIYALGGENFSHFESFPKMEK